MKHKSNTSVAIFFVATPLHYLASRQVALKFEVDSRCIVIPYMPVAQQLVNEREWDGVVYAPWPRFAPLPGPFGRHRRLLANLRDVAAAIGECSTVIIHSPVFDTEAINYFLRGLPPLCGAKEMHARILPDGLLNISRHPLTPIKRAAQAVRRLRRLASPQLDYWCFGGDRIGSEAPFVDRIYTLPGFPNDYPPEKVAPLPPLVSDFDHDNSQATDSPVLLLGQPLVGIGALSPQQHDNIVSAISSWLKTQGITRVVYKAHPRDPNYELRVPESQVLDITEPLESHMATHHYRAVIGVNSTALYLARQIYGPEVPVVSFGNDKVHFKNPDQAKKAEHLMDLLGIRRL